MINIGHQRIAGECRVWPATRSTRISLSDSQSPEEDLDRRCRQVVDRMVGAYGWGLIERGDLARRALQLIEHGRIEPAVMGAYCLAMYAACSGGEGVSRQNQGYAELARYLYAISAMRHADLRPELREEAVQSALERIFKAFSRCRQPVALLAFAAQHLLDAARVIRRHEYRSADSIEQLAWQAEPAGEALPDPLDQVIAADQRATIERLLGEYVAAHPRATQQVAILWMQWIERLDDRAISQRLGISLNSLYTARSRITKIMQSEPHWHTRARELGLFADEV
jgi:DNA-directed RNA polymerase specialized sigma24 family protein